MVCGLFFVPSQSGEEGCLTLCGEQSGSVQAVTCAQTKQYILSWQGTGICGPPLDDTKWKLS